MKRLRPCSRYYAEIFLEDLRKPSVKYTVTVFEPRPSERKTLVLTTRMRPSVGPLKEKIYVGIKCRSFVRQALTYKCKAI
jgi:hypothetical protein